MSATPVVLAAVPTLFDSDGDLDRDANRALYKLISGLLDGMLVAGTTGEFPALEDAERLWLAEQALAEAGPDRVIVHIGAPDARHAARLARAATALGARRIAAITPYYLPARPDELVTHYRSVREAAPGAEIYAYIFPERTGLTVSPALLAEAAQAASLAGAKISGSASADLAGYVAAAPGLRIFSGNDADPWATARAGAEGVISGRSSAYPELYAALVKDPAVQERLDRVVALGASVGRIKHALGARGLAGTGARMTVDPPDAQLAAAIEAEVAALSTVTCSLPARASTGGGGSASFCVEARRKRGAGPLHRLGRRKPSGRPGVSGAPGSARRERGVGPSMCPRCPAGPPPGGQSGLVMRGR